MMPKRVASLLFAWRNLVGETLFKYLEYRSNLFVVNLVVLLKIMRPLDLLKCLLIGTWF